MKRVSSYGSSYDEFEVGGNCLMEVCGWYDSPLRSIVLYPNTFIYCKRWESHRMQHHQYVCAALEFVVSGSATFLLDGKKTKVSAGEIFIMQVSAQPAPW